MGRAGIARCALDGVAASVGAGAERSGGGQSGGESFHGRRFHGGKAARDVLNKALMH
jgi:hypothetical protein